MRNYGRRRDDVFGTTPVGDASAGYAPVNSRTSVADRHAYENTKRGADCSPLSRKPLRVRPRPGFRLLASAVEWRGTLPYSRLAKPTGPRRDVSRSPSVRAAYSGSQPCFCGVEAVDSFIRGWRAIDFLGANAVPSGHGGVLSAQPGRSVGSTDRTDPTDRSD